ncbi:hypothetical protein SARC_08254 [Sphaeroforma arctica JP610]|uniref:Uncharacterized protein n=1 Tax=Sphaeroforma arctica JP610 TaxID=667725 RepID=A0A0L0FTT2_9EUKA|nr:hypothetical protein SARC_08254 [Sphaeroforma arctica JP610]KNC79348.1 hypothetical protein SARC_08254 [Sphaeroforma arctica JP610]|eukprot:XP_014153250.1 hypothetical protein SARC_08254 [Sphaeroforma arctica JP610]
MVSLLTPHGNVNVTGVSRIQDGFKYVEVEGIVNDDGSMQEMAVSNLGDNFGMFECPHTFTMDANAD